MIGTAFGTFARKTDSHSFENRYRVISETHGLVWTGDDPHHAETKALMAAVKTGRTVYLQDGTDV